MYSFSRNNFSSVQNVNQEETTGWFNQSEGVAVHTGFPNPGIDSRLRGLDLTGLLVKNSASTYMLRIAGHDWRHVGIFDGDIAVVDRALSPQPNDVVVWWHDGDFAISARSRTPRDATVWGVVTSVIHQYRYKVMQTEGVSQ